MSVITSQIHYRNNTRRLILISLIALLLGHLMINTIVANEILNLAGLIATVYFIYYNTLRRKDLFGFIMIIYFCSSFPYLLGKGGGFNLVSFVCVLIYYLSERKLPGEKKINDKTIRILILMLVVSSCLGWVFNYTGTKIELLYSFMSFIGIIFLLIISAKLELTRERIRVFLKINFVLIIYSTLATINKYANIITFKTPMMPIYGSTENGYVEGGGIIGSSPLYGEHSMILTILFAVFLLLGSRKYSSRTMLIVGAFISYLNVFMSISRSVFLLTILGICVLIILQYKLIKINLTKQIYQALLMVCLGFVLIWIVNSARLNYVFNRVDEIELQNEEEGGVTLKRILDGSAFNRKDAFYEGYKRYSSKESWLIGYGWGIGQNNRDAFYVDPTIERGSAHSQVFAILFILGWIGFVGYFGLILRIIIKSFKTSGRKNVVSESRIMAFFFMLVFILFLLNEIKADSISIPSYFCVTIIWTGFAISVNNPPSIMPADQY